MRKVLVAAALAVTMSIAVTAPTGATTGRDAQDFLARINAVRAEHGLPALAENVELDAVAQRWTDQMAASGGISHNRSLGGQVASPWIALGENVGRGTDVPALMQAFVDSPTHYANLVDPEYRYVGVAVRWGQDGRLYTTHLFMALEAAAAATVAAIAPAPAPAPRGRRAAVVLAELRGVDE